MWGKVQEKKEQEGQSRRKKKKKIDEMTEQTAWLRKSSCEIQASETRLP
jgi:hypothetical protein